ncbi:hypothetical protein CYLTODRAFT_361346 [Cylindrobasidium torrendii FP15055 ss-10]|uniref:CxC2-like cysteine cluster KDZ transposase-associated domain-containing protein n=1 Tax=Cylindrobasidium torrendii FP15055 ss-10 TaxID=1314674 RepID=A0A0D7AVU6_9AGAR|nr:hypothetical protein CYLTODRAFT_361346 [Cylindrobasidium torrendii FP15055 ss-10]
MHTAQDAYFARQVELGAGKTCRCFDETCAENSPPSPGDGAQATSLYDSGDELDALEVEEPPKALYRCTECKHPALCADCVLDCHAYLPFHRLELWNGEFFEPTDLCELGLIYSLRHPGDPDGCPECEPGHSRSMTILDINGYRKVNVQFCYCSGVPSKESRDEAYQLLEAGLWPQTLDAPRTAITFAVVENFVHHHNTDKKSAYNYCWTLRLMTDPIRPWDVPDSYRAFMRVVRIWQSLEPQRRSGQSFGIEDFITGRRPGSTSIFCPACPEIDFNVSKQEVDEASPEQEDVRHCYTLFLSTDGCFNCPRHILPFEDEDDFALMGGSAYIPDEDMYHALLDKFQDVEAEPSTCARLRAVKLQSLMKFKNLAVTGFVGTICTRHAFVCDNSLVDMYGGEGHMYSDISLMGALQMHYKQRWVRMAYDIWCQYVKKLLLRVARRKFPHLPEAFFDMLSRIKGGIPSFHVLGHIWSCRALYSYHHLPHTGETKTENIETTWVPSKLLGGSVKHANHGQRHDEIDATYMHWNYLKWIRLRKHIGLTTLLGMI